MAPGRGARRAGVAQAMWVALIMRVTTSSMPTRAPPQWIITDEDVTMSEPTQKYVRPGSKGAAQGKGEEPLALPAAASGAGPAGSKGKRRQQHTAEDHDELQKAVRVLALLVRNQQMAIRELQGAVLRTIRIATADPLVTVGKEAGTKYPEAYGKGPQAPHVACANLLGCAELRGPVREKLEALYGTSLTPTELTSVVRHFRIGKTYRSETSRIVLVMAPEFETPMVEALLAVGGVLKAGAPPRGSLEMEVDEVIQKLRK